MDNSPERRGYVTMICGDGNGNGRQEGAAMDPLPDIQALEAGPEVKGQQPNERPEANSPLTNHSTCTINVQYQNHSLYTSIYYSTTPMPRRCPFFAPPS